MKALHMHCKDCKLNMSAVSWPSVAVSLILAAILCACCAHRPQPIPDHTYTPAEALSNALFDSCRSAASGPPTEGEAVCDKRELADVDVGILRLGRQIDEMSVTADARNQIYSVKMQELQGRVNEEAARADRNAQWIWIVAGIGAVMTLIGFGVGVAAF